MNKKRQYDLTIFSLLIITMIPFMSFFYKQIQENNIVDDYIVLLNLKELPITKKTAIYISDKIRKDFNTDKHSFVALNLNKRPFLREDAGFLLTHKEGLCGEGTRVLVVILNRLGFDATRITLFNKELQSAHTLVSVEIKGKEFFVDSINSTSDVNNILREQNISTDDYNILHYTDDIAVRGKFKKHKTTNITKKYYDDFFNHYWLYSYEGIPYTKLLTKIGLDIRIFNFDRPIKLMSNLAEKPNMLMSVLMFFFSMITVVLIKLKLLPLIFTRKT